MKTLSCLLLLVLSVSGSAVAKSIVTVEDAWARSTVIMQTTSGAFMKLTASEDAKLIAAKAAVAGVVEVHEMKTVDGVMRMNAITSLDLPKGKPVELGPGGYHIMLMDLKERLKIGDVIDMTLTIEDAKKERSELLVKVPIHSFTSRKAAQEKKDAEKK
jgi:periplasmic copper chaperone A